MLPVDLVPNFQIQEPLPALAPGEQRFLLKPAASQVAAGRNDQNHYIGVYFAGPVENGKERKGEWTRLADRMTHTHGEHLPQIQECQARGEGYMLVGKIFASRTLRDVLEQKNLTMPDLETVCHGLINGLEDAIDAGWPELPLTTRGILARRAGSGALEVQLPVPPLCPAIDEDDRCAPPVIPANTAYYLPGLARLIYTLLGGRPPVAPKDSLSAPPKLLRPDGLSDLQFALLQEFLLPEQPPPETGPALAPEDVPETAPDFFSRFFGKPWERQEVEQWSIPAEDADSADSTGVDLRISPLYAGQCAWTNRLRLLPTDDRRPPLQLTAGTRFFIGRSPLDADYVAQFTPRSAENDKRTLKINRRHAALRALPDGQGFRFENLSEHSTPQLDEQLVRDSVPLPETETTVLALPGGCRLEMLRLAGHYQAARTCSDPDLREDEPSRLHGAFAVLPLTEGLLPFSALWLLSDAALYFHDDELAFLPPDPYAQPALRFHHFAGAFWIERLLDPIPVTIDEWEIEPGHTAPLLKDSSIAIGDTLTCQVQIRE